VKNGKYSNQKYNRLKIIFVLVGIFCLVDVTLGTYHMTHGGGWLSGSIELLVACLVFILTLMFYRSPQTEGSLEFNRLTITLLAINGAIALTLLILSIYHFTHFGFLSGIIELSLAAILAIFSLLLLSYHF
jgi:hypothetical protein